MGDTSAKGLAEAHGLMVNYRYELKEIEHIKNNQINELKSQFQVEIQTVKRQTSSSHDVYEQ